MESPQCTCLARCWAYNQNPDEPCWGKIQVSETYPGEYVHYCDGHGHYEDNQPYRSTTPDDAEG